jgi:hypothetical protein
MASRSNAWWVILVELAGSVSEAEVARPASQERVDLLRNCSTPSSSRSRLLEVTERGRSNHRRAGLPPGARGVERVRDHAARGLQSRFLEADPRGLILRVLATSGQVAGSPKMTAADLSFFLDGSFAPSQQRQRGGAWCWTEQALAGYVAELARHGLILAGDEQR